MTAREEILARVRASRPPHTRPVHRGYRTEDPAADRAGLTELLIDRLVDYKATVRRATVATLPAVLSELLAGSATLVLPAGVPEDWLAGGADGTAYPRMIVRDGRPRPLTVAELDAPGVSVLTGCAVAVAETGTLILDGGAESGRRVLTLVPDHHLCVVRMDQIVAGVPAALARLSDPTRPLTLVSGPSATSDIELNRVEGVHGPRRLDVVITA